MQQTPELQTAIEELYRVFEGYRLSANTDPCPCCHSPEEDRRLRSKPLRNLSSEDLWQYTTDALYTWGGENEFKHFLPRILELLTLVGEPSSVFVDPECVLGKLTYSSQGKTSWHRWPTLEQAAISRYLHAVWPMVLDTHPDDLSEYPYEWLCAFAFAEGDLSWYLEYWLTAASVNAHRNLARMVVFDGLPNATRPTDGYWADCKEQWQQLVDWLVRPEVREKLAAATERWGQLPFAKELYDAVVLLPS